MKTFELEDLFEIAQKEGVDVADPDNFGQWVIEKGYDYNPDTDKFISYED